MGVFSLIYKGQFFKGGLIMDRKIRSFNIDEGLYKWLERWKEQSGLSMSEIVNKLILDRVPASLTFTGIGYDFVAWKTTADLENNED